MVESLELLVHTQGSTTNHGWAEPDYHIVGRAQGVARAAWQAPRLQVAWGSTAKVVYDRLNRSLVEREGRGNHDLVCCTREPWYVDIRYLPASRSTRSSSKPRYIDCLNNTTLTTTQLGEKRILLAGNLMSGIMGVTCDKRHLRGGEAF